VKRHAVTFLNYGGFADTPGRQSLLRFLGASFDSQMAKQGAL